MAIAAQAVYDEAIRLINEEGFLSTLSISNISLTKATPVSVLTEVSTFVSRQMEDSLCAALNQRCCPAGMMWQKQTNKFPDLILTADALATGYGIEIKACFSHVKEASSRFWESANLLCPGKITILIVSWCLETCDNSFCSGRPKVINHLTVDAYQTAIQRGMLHHKPEDGRIIKEPAIYSGKGQKCSAVRALVVLPSQKKDLAAMVHTLRKTSPKDLAHTSSEQALVEIVIKHFTFSQDSNCGKLDRILGRFRCRHAS